MKKVASWICFAALTTSSAYADMVRVETGIGGWNQQASGYISRTDGDGALALRGTYTSAEKKYTEIYAWALIKHPVPIVPNLRLEYVSIQDKGEVTGSVDNINLPLGGHAKYETKQYDVIPYYNLLDNTFWITLDIGIDAKFVQTKTDVTDDATQTKVYSGSDSVVIPLGYLRARMQIPTTGLGVETDLKYITYSSATFYDARAKVDYTFDISPLVQPAIEIGYRVEKLYFSDSDSKVDLRYKGVYAGAMLRF